MATLVLEGDTLAVLRFLSLRHHQTQPLREYTPGSSIATPALSSCRAAWCR